MASSAPPADISSVPPIQGAVPLGPVKNLPEGGQKITYNSTATPDAIFAYYNATLSSGGWNIEETQSDPFGGGITASTDAGQFVDVEFNLSQAEGKSFIDVCWYPAEPSNSACGGGAEQETEAPDGPDAATPPVNATAAPTNQTAGDQGPGMPLPAGGRRR